MAFSTRLKMLASFYLAIGIMVWTVPTTTSVSVPDVVADAFFNGIIGQAELSCVGKNFYSCTSFLGAHNFYHEFGIMRSDDDAKREIATVFVHVTHKTRKSSPLPYQMLCWGKIVAVLLDFVAANMDIVVQEMPTVVTDVN
ncbi:hypothetical protein Ancab_019791 [Ancistrocladus abbreviatus]